MRVITGDCRDILPTLPADSVHCCVTSPPYWGLRDYGVAGQLGLEPTFTEFIDKMVEVFREVRRVLRPDGTLWLNLGDSYAGSFGAQSKREREGFQAVDLERFGGSKSLTRKPSTLGLKPKDLCGIPWRVAFALQEDGWWLRQDIIWSKPNPMPESVTDRCTKSHEYVFLLTKSARYFYDAEAIKEDASTFERQGTSGILSPKTQALQDDGTHGKGGDLGINYNRSARNKRSVWDIATSPFPQAHFATFPPALVEPCIKAGTSERGCCAKCGAPWARVLEVESRPNAPPCNGKYDGIGKHRTVSGGVSNDARARSDRGWQPTCTCQAAVIPCTVLDPFGGAGTTGLVADRLQRNAILIELNPTYAEMARRRLIDDAPLFVEAAE